MGSPKKVRERRRQEVGGGEARRPKALSALKKQRLSSLAQIMAFYE